MPKPIKIESYKCPICNTIINGSYEDAVKHVNIPVDKTPFPVGLVLLEGSDFSERTVSPFIILELNRRRISSEDHGTIYHYYDGSKEDLGATITSKTIKDDLQEKYFSFLTESEFKEFKYEFQEWGEKRVHRFFRITPKLKEIFSKY